MSAYLSVNISVSLFFCFSLPLPLCLCLSPSHSLSVSLPPSVYVCARVCFCVCMPVSPSLSPCLSLSLSPPISIYINDSHPNLHICMHVRPSTCAEAPSWPPPPSPSKHSYYSHFPESVKGLSPARCWPFRTGVRGYSSLKRFTYYRGGVCLGKMLT